MNDLQKRVGVAALVMAATFVVGFAVFLGVVIAVAGLLTVVPALEVLGPVFGLGLIVWFVWLGIVMLRSSPSAA